MYVKARDDELQAQGNMFYLELPFSPIDLCDVSPRPISNCRGHTAAAAAAVVAQPAVTKGLREPKKGYGIDVFHMSMKCCPQRDKNNAICILDLDTNSTKTNTTNNPPPPHVPPRRATLWRLSSWTKCSKS